MKKWNSELLNAQGFSHIIVLAMLLVGFGALGTYLLVDSHADSYQVPCSANGKSYAGNKEYNCSFYQHNNVVSGSVVVGSIDAGTNWVLCQQKGPTMNVGKTHNYWWAYTKANNGKMGWVNAVYAKGGSNNGSFGNVPQCNGKFGSTPNPVI